MDITENNEKAEKDMTNIADKNETEAEQNWQDHVKKEEATNRLLKFEDGQWESWMQENA